jgi:hypothetical protein
MPIDAHPLLLGSGQVGLAVDATGLQGLNARTNLLPDTISLVHGSYATTWNLYLHRNDILSRHHGQRGDQAYRLMPGGWVDYVLTIDGQAYEPADLAESARAWSRRFSPETGVAEIRYRLGPVEVQLRCAMGPGDAHADAAFELRSTDGDAHEVGITLRCHQTLRDGRPLATGGMETECDGGMIRRTWEARTETSSADVYQPATVAWTLACDAQAACDSDAERIGCHWQGSGERLTVGFRIIAGADRDQTDTPQFAADRVAELRAGGADEALKTTADRWAQRLADKADVHVGNPLWEYLCRQVQFSMLAGGGFANGYPLGTLWNATFGAATFWDTFFVCDGLLRAGHVQPVRDFCDWLVSVMADRGRPFYWMTYYDGRPVETDDQAYQVCLAYAVAAIRLYHVTGDDDDLRLRVQPYLLRVAEYLLNDVLVASDGSWVLHGEVAHDVGVEGVDATREWGMLHWAVVCLERCAAYARRLGETSELTDRCQQIADHFKDSPIPMDQPGAWGAWYPYLAGASPMMDCESFGRYVRKTLPLGSRPDIHGQPWFATSAGAGLLETGWVDEALAMTESATHLATGFGYLTESPYELRSGGFAPYPPAQGSYLSVLLGFFAHGDAWSDEIHIAHLPRRWRHQHVSWSNVTTLNGARVSGSAGPRRLEVTVETDRDRPVRIGLPGRIEGEPVRAVLNGQVQDWTVDGKFLVGTLPAGRCEITVERDLDTSFPVLVVEPFSHGREVCALLAQSGKPVRWLRDMNDLPRVVDAAEVIYIHVSYVALPVDLADCLESAARRGARVITLFHAGVARVDSAMAELNGVRATQLDDHWSFESIERDYQLTPEGRSALPALPERLRVPQTGTYQPDPAEGVEVLATADGKGTVTRRRVGDGWVCWLAAGNVNAGGTQWSDVANANDVYCLGIAPEDKEPRPWLDSDHWRRLLQVLATSDWS